MKEAQTKGKYDINIIKDDIIKKNLIDIESTLLDCALLFVSLIKENYPYTLEIPFHDSVYDNVDPHLISNYIINQNKIKLPIPLIENYCILNILLSKNYKYVFNMNFKENTWQKVNLVLLSDYIIKNRKFPHIFLSSKNNQKLYELLLSKESDMFFKSMDLTVYEKLNEKDIANLIIKLNIKEIPATLLSKQTIFNILLEENYQNLSQIPFKLELYQNYGINKVIDSMSLDSFSDYLINQNIINLPEELLSNSNLFNILVAKNYQKTLYIHFNIDIYEKNLSKVVSFIIKNNLTEMNEELLNNFELFCALLEQNYSHFKDISFNIILYNMYGLDKIINKFSFESFISYLEKNDLKTNFSKIESPKVKERIINHLLNINYKHLFHHITEISIYKNIEISKLGNYIIKNNLSSLGTLKNFPRNQELLTYLLINNYSKTFDLNFEEIVYQKVDESLLIEFIKNNNLYFDQIPKSIKNSTKLIAYDLSLPKTNLKNVEAAILYYFRIKSNEQFKKYQGLSLKISQMLKEEDYLTVINYFKDEINEITKVLNFSLESIINLFKNYQKNSETYQEEINNLIRKFIIKGKELSALDNYQSLLTLIKTNHTTIEEEYKEITKKKTKRKLLYLTYIKKCLLNEEISNDILSNLDFLKTPENNLTSYEIIEKIINGSYFITPPDSYKLTIKTKALRRLKNNYHNQLLKILNDQQNLSYLIIGFLNETLTYDDIKPHFTKDILKVIIDIEVLIKEADVTIEYQSNNLIWQTNYKEATEEDFKQAKNYEYLLKKLKNLTNILNKDINEFLPLEKIILSESELLSEIDKVPNKSLEINIDSFPSTSFSIILEILFIGKSLKSKELQNTFNKFFLDTGLLLSLITISDINYLKKIILVAKNIDIIHKNFNKSEINIQNIDKIIKKSLLYIYATEEDCAILDEEVVEKITYNDSFILEPTDENKKSRVAQAICYHVLSKSYIESTVPYSEVKYSGFCAKRYKNTDPQILTSGIDTDVCFKISGVNNDFLLYTMFNKNGFVYKITDEQDNLIGKVAGFRNGNIVYFNELTTIYDRHNTSVTKEIIEIEKTIQVLIQKLAETLIEDSKDDEYPIEYVTILNAFSFQFNTELSKVSRNIISFKPMDTTHENWQEFTNNNQLKLKDGNKYFKTDYATIPISVLLLASKEGTTLERKTDIKNYDPSPIYIRPREKIIIKSKEEVPNMLKKINQIYATYCYSYDLPYSKIENLDHIETIIIGEDWYLTIDKFGNSESIIIPLDKRAISEEKEIKEKLSLSNKVKVKI